MTEASAFSQPRDRAVWPTAKGGDRFLEEENIAQEIKVLEQKVKIIREKYHLRLPLPSYPLLLLIHRAIDPTAFAVPGQGTNPLHPGIMANWFGFAERIHRFGITGLNSRLIARYEGGGVSETEGKPDRMAPLTQLLASAGIDNLPETVFTKLLQDCLIPNVQTTHLFEKQLEQEEWIKTNLATRTALLWSGLIAQEELGHQPLPSFVQSSHTYDIQNEARRLALSDRAFELLKQGKLDIFLPPGYAPQTNHQSLTEYLDILKEYLPSQEWVAQLAKSIQSCEDRLIEQVRRLKEQFPQIPFPNGVLLVPVRYGTVGSFANQMAGLLSGLTIKPCAYDGTTNTLRSSYQSASIELGKPIDQRPFFQKVTDNYPAMESYYRYPFVVYVRVPSDVQELPGFIDASFVPMCIEEYIHTSLYIFSSFYQIPHSMEEHLVNNILQKLNLSHSGTPTSLSNDLPQSNEAQYIQLVEQFTAGKLSLGAFIETATRLILRDKSYTPLVEVSPPKKKKKRKMS